MADAAVASNRLRAPTNIGTVLASSCSRAPSKTQQVLVQQVGDDVFCVSNKCSHLGLSMQGKTALLSAKVDCSSGPCAIVCPAHGTAFDLATGAVKGVRSRARACPSVRPRSCASLRCLLLRVAPTQEWCPGMPDLPFVGKMKPPAPLPVFTVQVDGDAVSVSV